eukprot:scaffold193813_cov26-Tisochrysis_lutea.AAC.3
MSASTAFAAPAEATRYARADSMASSNPAAAVRSWAEAERATATSSAFALLPASTSAKARINAFSSCSTSCAVESKADRDEER